jgi:predicted metalloprotease
MGHHIQQLIGTSDRVNSESAANPGDANELSVRLELQADCYAGVWANTVFIQGDLEEGDLEEAFTATEAIGDDRLQKQAGGDVDSDSFTHGTSEQRRTWFERGYEGGDPGACDTFSPDSV